MFARMNLDTLPGSAHTLFNGCLTIPEVARTLTSDDYGFEPADFTAGLALVVAVEEKCGTQAKEYGDQYRATEAATLAVATLRTLFVRHRELARAKHKRGTPAYRALGLDDDVPKAFDALFAAADKFYRAIAEDPTLITGVRGLNAAALDRGRAALAAARKTKGTQKKETGEARLASDALEDDVLALRAQAGELAAVCEVAFADTPEYLVQLGLRP